ncbi:MAG: hypothetical protein ACPHRO_12625 [Nannocystaceae bacterium]
MDTPEDAPVTPPPGAKPKWIWPLRIGAQVLVLLWVWKLYGCMQLEDCSDHPADSRMKVHLFLAVMVFVCIEGILLVNRLAFPPER